MRITIWHSCRKVNHLSKVVWDGNRNIITEFTRSISSTSIDKPVFMMKSMSLKTNTFTDGLTKRNSSMLDEIESKMMDKDKEDDR